MAIEHLTSAIQLNPFDPLAFKMHAALAYPHFFAGRYDDASAMTARGNCRKLAIQSYPCRATHA